MKILTTIIYIILSISLISCGRDYFSNGSSKERTSIQGLNNSVCECPTNVDKVCANGSTYQNACIAQCQGLTYTFGECTGNTTNNNCNSNSGTVCGQPPYDCPAGQFCASVMPNPVTYNNECDMVNAGSTFINSGQCSSIVVQ